jgi:hypothetical protein
MEFTWHLFNALIEQFGYSSYLEIGCKDNTTFSQVNADRKVGVDPNRGGTLRMTSDEYFEKHDDKFDLIFIDGLHERAQVLRDFANALPRLHDNGTIVFHDCDPPSEERQRVPQAPGQRGWCGDCWKAFVTVRAMPDVDAVCTTFDMGMGVIRVRPNTDLVALPKLSEELTWEDFVENRERWLRLTTPDRILEWVK